MQTSSSKILSSEPNLAAQAGVIVTTSMPNPLGNGAHSPIVLLNDNHIYLNNRPLSDFQYALSYDTYDGQNKAAMPDWYALTLPQRTQFNCIEMTTGFVYADGGWWTTLSVEIQIEDGEWLAVQNMEFHPRYSYIDKPYYRRPFESYALTFERVNARAVRLIGQPGGRAQFTSMGRIALYDRDLSRWNPAHLPLAPMPQLFSLIQPHTVWDLSQNLQAITGLLVSLPLYEMYLNLDRHQQFLEQVEKNYSDAPDLSLLISEAVGHTEFSGMYTTLNPEATRLNHPHVQTRWNGTLASAVAPVVVDSQVLGVMTTYDAVVKERYGDDWHRIAAKKYQIAWKDYAAALERSPQMTLIQMQAVAGLLGMIANTIANLAHEALTLRERLPSARRSTSQREIVFEAINFMQENLEEDIDIPAVAQQVALSVTHFNRIFHDQLGCNPGGYLINLKLERAKEYLTYTTMTVLEVCTALGYTPSYFTRLFKQRTGVTPSEFAKSVRSSL